MEVDQNEAWPYNLLCRIFDQEELEILKWNTPKELEAFLIYTIRDAYSDRKLLTEYRLDRSDVNELAELLKKKGYSCDLTRARNDLRIAYWPENLLVAGLDQIPGTPLP